MNTRKAAPVLLIGSLAVLLSGCAGAAVERQVNDNLKPLENAAAMGLARGHVIEKDDFSSQPFSAEVIRELKGSAPTTVEQPFSAEAIRELKGSAPTTVEQPFSAEVWRELKGSAPTTVEQPFSDAARRELKGNAPVAESAADTQGRRLTAYAEAYAAAGVTAAEMQGARLSEYAEARSDAEKRELKGSAPIEVNDYLSPLGGPR
ncbi:hypothetical protein [Agromyces albus]|uniref:DUF3035 domain-containing protein n=1 Tax=Agromyces albus TaxID=205332 RepID=A0A4Q2L2U6_9MICO|nr:hypothetical protein [Agromyces albus]RXZ71747.1 hypothetical protein ESP51_07585 [Agromyces albus]